MFIQPVSCDSDAFSHGKGGYNSTNSKSFDMSETESGEGSSDNQADYIEADLDFWICHRSDLGQLPWEKVSRDNRHFAAVGNSDSNTDQNVACNKIKNSPANCCRKNIIHNSCTSSSSPKTNPTTKLNRYWTTNFFRRIISASTRSP